TEGAHGLEMAVLERAAGAERTTTDPGNGGARVAHAHAARPRPPVAPGVPTGRDRRGPRRPPDRRRHLGGRGRRPPRPDQALGARGGAPRAGPRPDGARDGREAADPALEHRRVPGAPAPARRPLQAVRRPHRGGRRRGLLRAARARAAAEPDGVRAGGAGAGRRGAPPVPVGAVRDARAPLADPRGHPGGLVVLRAGRLRDGLVAARPHPRLPRRPVPAHRLRARPLHGGGLAADPLGAPRGGGGPRPGPPPGARVMTSRLPSFRKLSLEERASLLGSLVHLSAEEQALLRGGHTLALETANQMIENAVGTFALPLGMGLNLSVNGKDYLVPMAVEEPSVVAALSGAAKVVRGAGGFAAEADDPVMIGQVQVTRYGDPLEARERILARREQVLALANSFHPQLVRRGGGGRSLE